MKLVLWVPCVFIGIASAFASTSAADDIPVQQGSQMSTPADTSLVTVTKNDTVKSNETADSSLVAITVDSVEGDNVDITLILKKKTKVYSGALLLFPVNPDTIGTLNAPLIRIVPSGFYDILLHKEGFKDITRTMYPFTEKRDSLFIPFASIQRRRELFGTLKWISAGIAVAATAAALFIRHRITATEMEYNDATSTDVIKDKRSTIEVNRNNYKIATSVIGIAGAGFALCWGIELSF